MKDEIQKEINKMLEGMRRHSPALLEEREVIVLPQEIAPPQLVPLF